jgi:hypothetical protein
MQVTTPPEFSRRGMIMNLHRQIRVIELQEFPLNICEASLE